MPRVDDLIAADLHQVVVRLAAALGVEEPLVLSGPTQWWCVGGAQRAGGGGG
jgi:hypothetical protein